MSMIILAPALTAPPYPLPGFDSGILNRQTRLEKETSASAK